MNWNTLFNIPSSCRQTLVITKKSLAEQGDLSLSEAKLLKGAEIQSLQLIGVISPKTTNINIFENEKYAFKEVYFIQVILQDIVFEKYANKTATLLHKQIPHHCLVLLQSENKQQNQISLGFKRISENSPDLRVLENTFLSNNLTTNNKDFVEDLQFQNAKKLDLKTLYDYYLQVLQNFNLMQITNNFVLRPAKVSKALVAKMKQIEENKETIAQLKRKLQKTVQMQEKVQLNTQIYNLKTENENLTQVIKTK